MALSLKYVHKGIPQSWEGQNILLRMLDRFRYSLQNIQDILSLMCRGPGSKQKNPRYSLFNVQRAWCFILSRKIQDIFPLYAQRAWWFYSKQKKPRQSPFNVQRARCFTPSRKNPRYSPFNPQRAGCLITSRKIPRYSPFNAQRARWFSNWIRTLSIRSGTIWRDSVRRPMRQLIQQACVNTHTKTAIRIFACKQTKKADGYTALNQPISCVCPMTFVSTYIQRGANSDSTEYMTRNLGIDTNILMRMYSKCFYLKVGKSRILFCFQSQFQSHAPCM